MVVVENNSVGFAALEKLREREYPNIYYSIKSTHEFIDPIQAQHNNNAVAGFQPQTKQGPLSLLKLEEFIRNRLITIYSKRMLSEMTTFIWNNGKPQAQRSYHDDLIMSCAIGCWVRDTALVANKNRKLSIQRQLYNQYSNQTRHLTRRFQDKRAINLLSFLIR